MDGRLRLPGPPGTAPIGLAVVPAAGETGPVDDAERRSAAGMAPWRAAEFLRGRGLLRGLTAEVLHLAPEAVGFRVEPGGRPRLRGHPAGVSVSHTDRHTAAAVWPDGAVGVDVMEPPDELDARLVRRCCGERAERMLAEPGAAAGFARVWAVQEACVKAVGLGLGGLPWRIPVDPGARRGRWRGVRWELMDTGLPCVLAVAVQETPRRSVADLAVLVQHPARSGLHPAAGPAAGN
ncbi:4'-phosphopantetheinyl transferase superfamily protein [Amycolatopsis sp. NBC_00345]|uniref:4'-phosphopantetheinyl transferase family protein n=1 Tax=Amycolatopsis sp. NBC_00345 TaxID=2975955 RepID=UPI002E267C4B